MASETKKSSSDVGKDFYKHGPKRNSGGGNSSNSGGGRQKRRGRRY